MKLKLYFFIFFCLIMVNAHAGLFSCFYPEKPSVISLPTIDKDNYKLVKEIGDLASSKLPTQCLGQYPQVIKKIKKLGAKGYPYNIPDEYKYLERYPAFLLQKKIIFLKWLQLPKSLKLKFQVPGESNKFYRYFNDPIYKSELGFKLGAEHDMIEQDMEKAHLMSDQINDISYLAKSTNPKTVKRAIFPHINNDVLNMVALDKNDSDRFDSLARICLALAYDLDRRSLWDQDSHRLYFDMQKISKDAKAQLEKKEEMKWIPKDIPTGSAIRNYTSEDSKNPLAAKNINKALREEKELTWDQNYSVRELKNAISRMPTHQGVVYRGTSKREQYNCDQGDMITRNKSFISTSAKASNAKVFKDLQSAHQGQMLVILSKKGRNIAPLSKFKAEEEVLFPPETKFKCLGTDGDNVFLEEIE